MRITLAVLLVAIGLPIAATSGAFAGPGRQTVLASGAVSGKAGHPCAKVCPQTGRCLVRK
jgi:hypothetical protein